METVITREQSAENPEATNATIANALAHAGVNVAPEVSSPPNDLVKLPGGLVLGGVVHRTAVVRELNGADEEALSRALQSGSAFRFMDVLIERGTVSVGESPATREMLKSMLVGDRDALALAIRIATYGDVMHVDQWVCPNCATQSDISFSLTEDVECRTLDDPANDLVFHVKLRKGGDAKVRMPNGADQDAIFENEKWTTAQRNTILLSRCILNVTNANGQEFNMAAFPSLSLSMSSVDRHAIIEAISKRQPGPMYNSIRFVHEECQSEVTLALGVRDLFRDLIAVL